MSNILYVPSGTGSGTINTLKAEIQANTGVAVSQTITSSSVSPTLDEVLSENGDSLEGFEGAGTQTFPIHTYQDEHFREKPFI